MQRAGGREDLCLQMPSQGLWPPPKDSLHQALSVNWAILMESVPRRNSQASQDQLHNFQGSAQNENAQPLFKITKNFKKVTAEH